MSLIVLIVTAIFLCLGIIQLFINFDISLLVTVVLTVIVGVLYLRADKQAKEAKETEKTAQMICKTIEQESNEAGDDDGYEQGQTTENS